MSNVAWITFKQPRTVKEIEAALRVIISKRFGNPDYSLVYQGNGYWDYDDTVPGQNGRHGVSIKTEGRKKVTFKSGATNVSDYMEYVLRTELGVAFGGMCGSEDDEEASWKPYPTKYPTFDVWMAKFG
jgi:hypothetical protein